MPHFEIITPKDEPDLGTYVGISLDEIEKYSDLTAAIRRRLAFRETLCGPNAKLLRSKQPPSSFAKIYRLGFEYDRKYRRMAMYHVAVDHEDNILCIENFFGYPSGLENPTIFLYLSFFAHIILRAAPYAIFAVVVFFAFKLFLTGG